MAAYTRKQYSGAARNTTTTTLLTNVGTTVDIAATTGWPSIAGIPFYVVIQPSSIYEEKCLATISGSTLTLIRAQDDTTASEHPIGSVIYPVFTANDADEANELVSKLTTKGDLLATDGTNLLRLGVGPNGYFLKANSSASAGFEWASIPTINSLDDIGDVTITAVEGGDFLTYDSSASVWVNETIHFITVSDTVPTDEVEEGDLWYNSVELELYTYYSGAWVQTTFADSGPQELYELADVSIEDPVQGETLVYDGTNWVNDGVSLLSLNDVGDVSITSAANGDFLRWNSSASVWVNDAVNLSTDTVGDYVQSLVAGTGVVISNNSGESATPTIAIGQAVATSSSVTFAHVTSNVTGDLTGNADTATALETSRTIQLSGDVSGSASFDGTNNINISTVVNTSSVAITELFGVNITNPQEFQTLEFDGAQWVNQYSSVVSYVRNAEATTLTTGTVVYLFGGNGDHASVKRADNTTDATSSKTVGVVGAAIAASQNGPVITRGYVDGLNLSAYTSGDVLWLGKNGQVTTSKPSAPDHLVFIGVVVRATNNGILYVATQNGYEIEELHDVKISGVTDGQFLRYNSASAIWVNDIINLGTDTSGNYISGLFAGTGIAISHTPSEDSTASVSLNAILDDISDVDISMPAAGDFLKWTGSKWANEVIDLGTDTEGSYMLDIVAGTGLSVTHTQGEASTASVSLSANIEDLNNVDLTGLAGNAVLQWSSASSTWIPGQIPNIGTLDDISDVAAPSPSVGDVLTWSGSAWVGDQINLGTDTTGDYVTSLVAGTGVTLTNNSGEGATPTIAIGQAVGTSSEVTFASLKTTSVIEPLTISATAATGTVAVDAANGTTYYTTNASANWVVNLRWNSGTTLDSKLSTGEMTTTSFMVRQGSTAYYPTSIQVNGTTSGVTTRWQGSTGAPTSGNANSTDMYTFTVVKTGSATFDVFAAQTRFA